MTLVPYSRRFLNTKTLSSDSNDHGPDFVVVLAALVCGTVCLLSLIAAVRCAWISHFSGRSTRSRTTTSATQSQGNKALKKKFLRKIPKVPYTGSAEDAAKFRDCAICLTEFVAGDVLRVLPQCGHGFHVVCVDMWLRSHSSCPSCRQILGDSTELTATANQVAGVENNHIPLTVR